MPVKPLLTATVTLILLVTYALHIVVFGHAKNVTRAGITSRALLRSGTATRADFLLSSSPPQAHSVTTEQAASAICQRLFGKRAFHENGKHATPTLLLSIPGSGSTWFRLLLEYATGLYTGSIYNEKMLFDILPGCENSCGNATLVINAHPGSLILAKNEGTSGRRCLKLNKDATTSTTRTESKCRASDCFKKALILIRDPFQTIGILQDEHSKGIMKLLPLQRRVTVPTMKSTVNKNIGISQLINSYVTQWRLLESVIDKFPRNQVTVIKYENLLDPLLRIVELQKALTFLEVRDIPARRLDCAFNLSSSLILLATSTGIDKNIGDGRKSAVQTGGDGNSTAYPAYGLLSSGAAAVATPAAADAYRLSSGAAAVATPAAVSTPPTAAYRWSSDTAIVCRIWHALSSQTKVVMKYGYTVWNNTRCAYVHNTEEEEAGGNDSENSSSSGFHGKEIAGDSSRSTKFPQTQAQQAGKITSIKLRKSLSKQRHDGVTKEQPPLTPEQIDCKSKYGDDRAFYDPATASIRNQRPVLLYSIPGSGNTWSRLLLEYSTGIYTGTAFPDNTLDTVFPGETHCGNLTLVTKGHPGSFLLSKGDRDIGFSDGGGGRGGSSDTNNHRNASLNLRESLGTTKHCNRTKKFFRFERAIIVIRDPYHSIWSEYNRRFSPGHKGEHNHGILKRSFRQSSAKKIYAGVLTTKLFASQFASIDVLTRSFHPDDYVLVRYENLANQQRRTEELQKMLHFLGYKNVTKKRVQCSFIFSESPKIRRVVDKAKMATIDMAYDTPEIVCSMWAVLSSESNISKYGYTPWKNTDCKNVKITTFTTTSKDDGNDDDVDGGGSSHSKHANKVTYGTSSLTAVLLAASTAATSNGASGGGKVGKIRSITLRSNKQQKQKQKQRTTKTSGGSNGNSVV